jgi:hypothetical protein
MFSTWPSAPPGRAGHRWFSNQAGLGLPCRGSLLVIVRQAGCRVCAQRCQADAADKLRGSRNPPGAPPSCPSLTSSSTVTSTRFAADASAGQCRGRRALRHCRRRRHAARAVGTCAGLAAARPPSVWRQPYGRDPEPAWQSPRRGRTRAGPERLPTRAARPVRGARGGSRRATAASGMGQ